MNVTKTRDWEVQVGGVLQEVLEDIVTESLLQHGFVAYNHQLMPIWDDNSAIDIQKR